MGTAVQSRAKVRKKTRHKVNRIPAKTAIQYEQYNGTNERIYNTKRMVDLVIGCIGFIIYLLIFPFFALGIKISSRGPVLFKQARIGKHGKIFQCYKFRTMHIMHSITKNGKPVVTKKDDSRIFRFGRFMRKYNVDEIPQIINVLKGEMSLVGPRPYHVKECVYWNQIFDDHHYRYIVPPGITGFAQARGLRGGTLNEGLMRKRLDNDLVYVEKNSLQLDLKIMYKTVEQMLRRNTNGH